MCIGMHKDDFIRPDLNCSFLVFLSGILVVQFKWNVVYQQLFVSHDKRML